MRREISVKADVNDDSGHTTPIALSHSAKAWAENCVAIGHAASVIEPLTPAPVMLLQRDIERLLSLIPISLNMSVEAQQYNRAYALDYQHAEIFNAAFLVMENTPDNDYWIRDMTPDIISKLDRKLAQFLSRGALVSYDLEPFNSEDWSILHYGMQRQPKRRDVFAAQQDKSRIGTQLNGLQKSISDTVRKMPPHHIYMDKLVSYLKRKQGSHV
jgi:tryptophan halogenase